MNIIKSKPGHHTKKLKMLHRTLEKYDFGLTFLGITSVKFNVIEII